MSQDDEKVPFRVEDTPATPRTVEPPREPEPDAEPDIIPLEPVAILPSVVVEGRNPHVEAPPVVPEVDVEPIRLDEVSAQLDQASERHEIEGCKFKKDIIERIG